MTNDEAIRLNERPAAEAEARRRWGVTGRVWCRDVDMTMWSHHVGYARESGEFVSMGSGPSWGAAFCLVDARRGGAP